MEAGPALADGIADYLAAVRRGPPAAPEVMRLASDLDADKVACPRPEGMKVTTSFIAGEGRETPVRIYRPATAGPQPAIVYFHGGAFTAGSIETFDPLAAALSEATGATVISVHYTRLPHTTPHAMLEECYEALNWTARLAPVLGIDEHRIAVAGDSAGAFLATHVALAARDRAGPAIACQLLFYGVFDLDETRAAYRTSRDPVLSLPLLTMMIETYRSCDARAPSLAPPLHCDDLSRLPPALFVEAEHDAVVEEGQEYAARLQKAGVEVQMRIAPLMPHGFFRAVRFSAPARDEMRRLAEAARPYLYPARTE